MNSQFQAKTHQSMSVSLELLIQPIRDLRTKLRPQNTLRAMSAIIPQQIQNA